MADPVKGKFQVVDSQGNPVFTIDPDSGFEQIVYTLKTGQRLMDMTNSGKVGFFSFSGHEVIRLEPFGISGISNLTVRAEGDNVAIQGVGVPGRAAVQGQGTGDNSFGVVGMGSGAPSSVGVVGNTDFGAGTGVHGHTSTGVGVLGTSDNTAPAGRFDGNVQVTKNLDAGGGLLVNGVSRFEENVFMSGDISCSGNINGNQSAGKTTITCFDVVLSGGDCAEDFDVHNADSIEPGMVMVIDELGALRACDGAYDKRVAGVISGAADFKPGIVLDKRESGGNRKPVALFGKVCCKADAAFGSIEVGDLLTTSPTLGHAMKAQDPVRAFGAVIGKALGALDSGEGLIPILIALQ